MSFFKNVIIFISLLILENIGGLFFSVKGVVIDFFLIYTLFWGIHKGEWKGFAIGLLCGGIEDIKSFSPDGVKTISKSICGYTAGKITRMFSPSATLTHLLLLFSLSLFNILLVSLLIILKKSFCIILPSFNIFIKTLLIQPLLNTIIGLFIFRILDITIKTR